MAEEIPISYTLHDTQPEPASEANVELEIIRALAAGHHPLTGAPLPDDSCYQSVKVVRALYSAIKALEKTAARTRVLPPRAGSPWSKEKKELGVNFDQGIALGDLARKHARTRGAIQSRLEKLGKIAPLPNRTTSEE